MKKVFFDPSGKRKKHVKWILIAVVLIAVFSACIFTASIVIRPEISESSYFHSMSGSLNLRKHKHDIQKNKNLINTTAKDIKNLS